MENSKRDDDVFELPSLPTKIEKEVRVQYDGKQYSIRIPISIVEELNIKKGDVFIIKYDPETKEYSFELKIKNKNVKKKS